MSKHDSEFYQMGVEIGVKFTRELDSLAERLTQLEDVVTTPVTTEVYYPTETVTGRPPVVRPSVSHGTKRKQRKVFGEAKAERDQKVYQLFMDGVDRSELVRIFQRKRQSINRIILAERRRVEAQALDNIGAELTVTGP